MNVHEAEVADTTTDPVLMPSGVPTVYRDAPAERGEGRIIQAGTNDAGNEEIYQDEHQHSSEEGGEDISEDSDHGSGQVDDEEVHDTENTPYDTGGCVRRRHVILAGRLPCRALPRKST